MIELRNHILQVAYLAPEMTFDGSFTGSKLTGAEIWTGKLLMGQ